MFDGADSGPDRVLDPVGALGVGHDEHAGRGRLRDHHVELVGPEMGVARIVAGREDATRGRDLDDVRAHPMQLADLAPDLVGPVHDARRPARMRTHERDDAARRIPVVAVTAGLAEHDDRDLEAGPRQGSVRDGLLDPEVGATGIASRRDPDLERSPEVLRSLVELGGERPLRPGPEIDVRHADMDVAIEEPGQDRPIADVGLHVAVEAAAQPDDPAILKSDVGRCRVAPGAVEDAPAAQDRSCHPGSSVVGTASGSAAGPVSIRARKRSTPSPAPASR